jgi:hypothetical protein
MRIKSKKIEDGVRTGYFNIEIGNRNVMYNHMFYNVTYEKIEEDVYHAIKHNLFDGNLYYNELTDHEKMLYRAFVQTRVNMLCFDIDNTLEEFFKFEVTPISRPSKMYTPNYDKLKSITKAHISNR